jgi:hypothetical protein
MINLDTLDTRTLQKEAARVIATIEATSDNIYNSLSWYKAAINWYIEQHGDLPSKTGPGKNITFIIED